VQIFLNDILTYVIVSVEKVENLIEIRVYNNSKVPSQDRLISSLNFKQAKLIEKNHVFIPLT
jgi:hypothetical protein